MLTTRTSLFRTLIIHAIAAATVTASGERAACVELPDLESVYGPPENWNGPVFHLSKAYPETKPAEPQQPWTQIDFVQSPAAYLQSVLDYCFEGNLDANSADPEHFDEQFKVESNATRKWFHAPWMHVGRHPREFIHGLTDERPSDEHELAATQGVVRNYAVGFYNEIGGFTFGEVWVKASRPDESSPQFGEGTVSFKLLFTEGTDTQIPWLKGAPSWKADAPRKSKPADMKAAKALNLLQVDVAVRDSRSKCGGWILGTFHYDSSIADPNPWRRLRPFALMWGNNEGLTPAQVDLGSHANESWLNPESPLFQYRASGQAPSKVFGWAGRANGPVDNPLSSCLSCHSTAHSPAGPLLPPKKATVEERLAWFKNLAPGQSLDPTPRSMDFSLQLAVGIENYKDAHPNGIVDGMLRMLNIRGPAPVNRSGEKD
jgi:hypothetical protein